MRIERNTNFNSLPYVDFKREKLNDKKKLNDSLKMNAVRIATLCYSVASAINLLLVSPRSQPPLLLTTARPLLLLTSSPALLLLTSAPHQQQSVNEKQVKVAISCCQIFMDGCQLIQKFAKECGLSSKQVCELEARFNIIRGLAQKLVQEKEKKYHEFVQAKVRRQAEEAVFLNFRSQILRTDDNSEARLVRGAFRLSSISLLYQTP
jgi:hypothetical protein